MKTLYFDIDGTVLMAEQAATKPRLAGGELESAIRMAGFQKLVCVGNFCNIAAVMKDMGLEYDELGVLLDICGGAFTDALWFRSMTTLVPEPQRGHLAIDLPEEVFRLEAGEVEFVRAEAQCGVVHFRILQVSLCHPANVSPPLTLKTWPVT